MAASVLFVVALSLSSFSLSSTGKTLLGGSASLCTRGPGHWCQNVETAQSCDALKYCQQKVWKAQDNQEAVDAASSASSTISSVPMIPLDNAVEVVPMVKIGQAAKAIVPSTKSSSTSSVDLCTYCEEVVNYAKILLGNPDAEKEIEGLLEGMCEQLGPLKEPCQEFVQQNIEKIVHTLAHLDTKTVCIQLHMCSASEDNQIAKNVLAPIRSLACEKCRSLSFGLLEKLQSSADALSKLSVDFCHLMGRDDILCHHHAVIFLASTKVVGSKDYFCSFLCEKEVPLTCDAKLALKETKTTIASPATTTSSPNPQPPACTQCIEALSTVKENLVAKLACLETKLTTYCDAFPPLAAECKAAVEGFFKPLHAQIDALVPKDICVQASFGKGFVRFDRYHLSPSAYRKS